MSKATATKIEPKKLFTYCIGIGELKIIVEAEGYNNYGENEIVDFYIGEVDIATFKKWDYVIREEITS